MTVYVFASPKGGVAKTTSSAECAFTLAHAGRRVLAWDLEPQGHYATRLGITPATEITAVTSDVLKGDATLIEAAVPSPAVPGVDVVVGTRDLAPWDNDPETVHVLADELARLDGEYGDVVIDTPPSLANLVRAAVVVSDVVVAPVECKTESYDAVVTDFVPFVERIGTRLRPGQQVHWFMPTMAVLNTNATKDVLEALAANYPGRITVPIRYTTNVADSYTSGMPVGLYRPDSTAALDYVDAFKSILAPSLSAVSH